MKRKKYKGKIIIAIMLITFFSWIYMGPTLLSKYFHELEESYIEKYTQKFDSKLSPVTYSVDKFELRVNSYREILEVSGIAFNEMKPEIKNRDIFIILESLSKKNDYIIKTQLMHRPDVLNTHLQGEDISRYVDVGYYAKFSAIGVRNGEYKVNIMVKENDGIYHSDMKFMIKKDKGMVTILPVAQ